MQIHVTSSVVDNIHADLLVVFGWIEKGDKGAVFSDEASRVDMLSTSLLREAVNDEKFEAGVGKTCTVRVQKGLVARRVMLAGAGDLKSLDAFGLLKIGAAVGRRSLDSKAKRVAIALSQPLLRSLGVSQAVQLFVEGVFLGAYEFIKRKGTKAKEKAQRNLDEVILLTQADMMDEVRHAVNTAQSVSDAVCFTRDLVNEPPSFTTPAYLGKVAQSLAKNQSLITCEVLGPKEIEKLGMGGLMGVARGSDEEPRFIMLRYNAQAKKTVALVGKGITFDTGGLSLKSAEGMETMKMDMAGAAAILGIFSALPALQPNVNVVGIICATENMPSGKATKPGDVLTAMNGKTIEVLNTDAEGRLVLADGLSYALSRIKPDVMIDLATLTGACVVALGEEVAGLFANNDELAEALLKQAKLTGEALWRLPLVKEYTEFIKSPIADIKNIGTGRWGGAITAALFLQEFTSDAVPWAHVDIAGPAFAEKESLTTRFGGTGYGVRMLLRYLTKATSEKT